MCVSYQVFRLSHRENRLSGFALIVYQVLRLSGFVFIVYQVLRLSCQSKYLPNLDVYIYFVLDSVVNYCEKNITLGFFLAN